MIYFDISRSQRARHRSGLMRVSSRLLEEFGPRVRSVGFLRRRFDEKAAACVRKDDWWFTAELFSEAECPGLRRFLQSRSCRTAAIFHDAIPLKLPHITWPQSVARHPEYMTMLAIFDRVFAVSEASRRDLVEFWRRQGIAPRARVETVALGADFFESRVNVTVENGIKRLVCVGIIEPRKNQAFLLDVCDRLWREGVEFELHIVGRVNPHFGGPVLKKIKMLRKTRRGLHYHAAADDDVVTQLYRGATATVFPTIAEGCGLPVLESLWSGVPCVCSDLEVLRENASGGGCVMVPVSDFEAWTHALRRVLTDDAVILNLRAEAASRRLPTWTETAESLLARLT